MTRRSAIAITAATAITLCAAMPVLRADEATRLRVEGRANAFPSMAADRSLLVLAWGATSPEGLADVYLAVSRDAGRSFGDPVRVNDRPGTARVGGELPPRVALVASDDEPVIVVTWGAKSGTTDIRVSTSTDGGRSFGASLALNTSGVSGDRGWHATTVDRSGTVHAMWLDHRALAARPRTDHARHGDGTDMARFSNLYYSAIRPPLAPAAAVAQGSGSAERALTESVCYCCKTALATGPDGAIYAAWRHVYPGNIRDIAFTVSRDAGKTFSSPTRVSLDNWQLAGCPDDGPAMAVGSDGTVHLVWPTVVREDIDGTQRTRGAVFYASTRDGRQFSSRIEVPTLGSLKPSHPQIASDEAGGFVVGWDEVRDAVRRAYVRTLRFNSARHPQFGDAIALDEQGSAYPVVASTTRGVFVAWTQGVGQASEIRVKRLD